MACGDGQNAERHLLLSWRPAGGGCCRRRLLFLLPRSSGSMMMIYYNILRDDEASPLARRGVRQEGSVLGWKTVNRRRPASFFSPSCLCSEW